VKVLIAVDELRIREFLQLVLEKIPEAEVVGQAENDARTIEMAKVTRPDLVFMDIKMPEMDGLFNAEAVRETVERLKQIEQQNRGLEKRLEKVLDSLEKEKPVKLPIALEGGNVVLIDTRNIQYIERKGLEVLVKTGKKTYHTNINLKEFELKLDPREFFRCHKGYIVRLDLIEEIVHSGRTFELLLSTGDRILLSREKEKQLRELYAF